MVYTVNSYTMSCIVTTATLTTMYSQIQIAIITPKIVNTDGHHKLIHWRMVTHGGIDGYSRLIVYLQCSSNNKSSTVYKLFLEATRRYGLPSREIRSGGRKLCSGIAHVASREVDRNSMIT